MIKVEYISFAKDKTKLSNEEDAAKALQEKFRDDLKAYPNAKGIIYILTSIRIFGQRRNDIDIFVIGFMEGFVVKNIKSKNFGDVKELSINSFAVNIELKSHPANKVKREGTDYVVTYGNVPHNASEQCREAKFSLLNHLQDQLCIKPFLCDILWFDGLTRNDIQNMRGNSPDNALQRGFSFREFINAILLQVDVLRINGTYILNSFSEGGKSFDDIKKLFTQIREPKGLTKSKFELLSQKNIDIDNLGSDIGNKLTIVTGRAGTGKTVQLLQLAFKLASEAVSKRCLLLTYNNALVSDIQRLIDYTPIPSKVDGRTVSIRTIDSFFQSLMIETDILKQRLVPTHKDYKKNYNAKLKELYTLVVDICNENDIDCLKDDANSPIDWDFIFVDEAQDFSDAEKSILFKFYGPNRIVVADGIDQFMRSGNRQMWEKGIAKDKLRMPKHLDLERRQKANLVTFVNAFAKLSRIDWSVKANNNIPGGMVKIYASYDSTIHNDLIQNCKKSECENYDILILVPPTMVVHDNDKTYFKNAENYKRANISIFDGTNPQNRTTYPTKDECRLYQYHSCRGLEGWCVVCDSFDKLVDYQLQHIDLPEGFLGFDKEQAKWRYVMQWVLMPLTRPVDTLIITISNTQSKIGRMLKELAGTYKDFVEWNIKD